MFLFKIRVLTFVLLIGFVAFYSAVIKAEATVSERLEESANDKDLTKLATMLNDLNTHTEIKEALTWLREKFITLEGGSRFTYLYATRLEKSRVNDTAVFTYLVAKLVARMDAARCKDNKLAASRIKQWEEGLDDLEDKYQNMPLSDAVYLSEMAISWEDKNKLRNPDPWLCMVIKKRAEKASSEKADKLHIRIVSKPFSGGKMVVVEDNKSKPQYLDNEQWLKARKKVLKEFNLNIRR